jgi:D-serine deaminase-like pyridoxal phosphate-dependent protein
MNRPPPAHIGDLLQSVDTPALVLDLDAFERNLSLMADAARTTGLALRPHAKSHKCPTIAALARRIAASSSLRFAGLHAYHGAAQHLRTAAQRQAAIAQAAKQTRATRELIEAGGIACPTVTGAGTGTFPLESASGVWNELQPGSYLFMDADYGRNEIDARWPRFEQSLFVLTTVMSRPTAERAVVDAGLKASSVDSGMPLVWARAGVEYVKASDEHGVLRIAPGARAPALGDKLLLVPGHCDPTVNLYEQFVCMRGGCVEDIWNITARGALW